MTRLEAIDALLVKVKAGEFAPETGAPFRWKFSKFSKFLDAYELAFGLHDKKIEKVWDAYKGSLDAAIALLGAAMPGAEYGVSNIGSSPGKFDAGIWLHCREYAGESDTPARALLIAILEAMKAKGEASA